MRRVLFGLVITGLLVPICLLAWILGTESGMRWSIYQVQPYINGKLSFNSLDGSLLGPITVNDLSYEDNDGVYVKADSIHIDWQPSQLVHARLFLSEIKVTGISVKLPEAKSATNNPELPGIVIPAIALPIDVTIADLTIDGLYINDDQQPVISHLSIIAKTVEQQIDIDHITLTTNDITATVAGHLQLTPTLSHQLNINWHTLSETNEKIIGEGSLQGDINNTHLDQQINGMMSFAITADIKDVLATAQADIEIRHEDMTAAVQASWSPDKTVDPLDISFNWQNLSWPPTTTPDYTSRVGNGWIIGNLSQFTIGFATTIHWSNLESAVYGIVDATKDRVSINQVKIETLEGDIIATGVLDLNPALKWDINLAALNINPGSVWTEWPGHLGGHINSNGALQNNQLQANINIQNIDGMLRDYPVIASGQAQVIGQTLQLTDIVINSGHSTLSLNGHISDDIALDWAINSTNIGELLPSSSGQISLSGHAHGSRQAPVINSIFEGRSIKISDNQIDYINGSITIDSQDLWKPNLSISAQGLSNNNIEILSVLLNGDQNNISANVITEQFQLNLSMTGNAITNGWQGQLVTADILSPTFQNWLLTKSVPASVTMDSSFIDTACWKNSSTETGEFCVEFEQALTDIKGKFSAQKIPLSTLGFWLPSDTNIEGYTDASANIHYSNNIVAADAKISFAPGIVRLPLLDNELNQWSYKQGEISLDVNESGINALATLKINDTDQINATLNLPDANLLALDTDNQTINADAHLSTQQLGVIDLLLSDVSDITGKAEFKLKVSGTLGNPLLNGDLMVTDGRAAIPRLGLNINDIKVRGNTNTSDRFDFHLSATSGKGKLGIDGHTLLDAQKQWPTTFTVKGNDFEVSHIPEAQVQASPDISIEIKQRNININGSIAIPFANLKPKDMTTAAQVSDDAIIINSESPVNSKWNVNTHLKIVLGERVNFFGFGYEGRFSGSVLIEDVSGQLTTATGELNAIEGRYRAYGQRLDIEQGRLLFTGGPVSNPGLDLRAVRHIGEVTAGIKVLGSLRQPQVDIFSVPAMGQTDALSYLLLGRASESSSGTEGVMMANAALALSLSGGDRLARTLGDRFGLDEMRVESNDTGAQASLVIGRYLSPKLYISYGVGLIDAYNTFNVRYQITDKWQLKGENGEYQSADFLYTIER